MLLYNFFVITPDIISLHQNSEKPAHINLSPEFRMTSLGDGVNTSISPGFCLDTRPWAWHKLWLVSLCQAHLKRV